MGDRARARSIVMMSLFAAGGHPVFQGTSPLSRGPLKGKGSGKTSIHYNAEPAAAELLPDTNFSVNQLSLYGAVSDWCQELAQRVETLFIGTGQHAAIMETEKPVSCKDVSNITKAHLWSSSAHGNLVQIRKKKFESLSKDLQLAATCVDVGFMRIVSCGQFYTTMPDLHIPGYGSISSCRRTLEATNAAHQKDSFEVEPEVAQYRKSWSQNILVVFGIEIQVNSMQKNGVVSRGMNKYVDELSAGHTMPIHYGEESISTARPVVIKTNDRTSEIIFIFVISSDDQTTKIGRCTLDSILHSN